MPVRSATARMVPEGSRTAFAPHAGEVRHGPHCDPPLRPRKSPARPIRARLPHPGDNAGTGCSRAVDLRTATSSSDWSGRRESNPHRHLGRVGPWPLDDARVVGEGGFEPPTASTQSWCATTAPLPGLGDLRYRTPDRQHPNVGWRYHCATPRTRRLTVQNPRPPAPQCWLALPLRHSPDSATYGTEPPTASTPMLAGATTAPLPGLGDLRYRTPDRHH